MSGIKPQRRLDFNETKEYKNNHQQQQQQRRKPQNERTGSLYMESPQHKPQTQQSMNRNENQMQRQSQNNRGQSQYQQNNLSPLNLR